MSDASYIVREPLLNSKQKVLGYRFKWHDDAGKDSVNLVEAVANALNDADNGWLFGTQLLFLNASPALLASDALRELPPRSTVLCLASAALAMPEVFERAKALRSEGYGISLKDAHAAVQDKALLELLSHIEIRFAPSELSSQAKLYGSLKQLGTRIVAKDIGSWNDYDACAALGLDALVGKLHLTPRPNFQPKGLNASQATILQLMNMVQMNADMRELEAILKCDPSVSYQLLRHINVAGFGQRAAVQSLRHAVSLLGYGPLYRWLSLLLATASTPGYSPVLMQTAIVRGRLAELLGAANLPAREAESLFVAGMFSLLDRLTGEPMDSLLEKVGLPADVKLALVERQGPLGPYLALAEACELNGSLVGSLAASLRISHDDVNKAHLSALAWANTLTAS